MRIKTPSFVAEFPLQTTLADETTSLIRLDAARNIYNASLGELLRRLTGCGKTPCRIRHRFDFL